MALTEEQRTLLKKKVQQRTSPSLSDERLKNIVNLAKNNKRAEVESSLKQVSGLTPLSASSTFKGIATEPKKQPSLIIRGGKAVAKSLLTSPARFLASVGNVGETSADLVGAGYYSLKGDEKEKLRLLNEASKDIRKNRVLPIVGSVTPVGLGGGRKSISDFVGVGGDIGFSLLGTGATGKAVAGTLAKQSLPKIAVKAGKIGALTGLGTETSQSLQRYGQDKQGSLTDELAKIAGSTILGGILGGAVGAGGELIKRGGKVAVREIKPLSNFVDKISQKNLSGRLIKEEMTGRAKDLGIDTKVVRIATKADDSLKDDAIKIINQTIEKKANSNVASPLQVTVGKKLENDLSKVLSIKERAGQGISKAKQALSDEQVDVSSVANKFIKRLQNSGVGIDDIDGELQLNFKGSDIAEGSAQDTKILKDIFNFLKPDDTGKTIKSAKDLINFRTKSIAEEKLYKARNELTKSEGLLSSVDSDFLRLLRPISKEYYDNTVKYAQTSSILNKFKKMLGDEFTDDDLVQGKLGDFSRKLINRYSTDTKGKIKDLYVGLNKLGVKVDPNKEIQKISDLVDLSDIAEKAIGGAPRSSAVETVKTGGEQALKSIVEPKQAIMQGFGKAIKGAFGKTEDEIEKEKIKVLKLLFKIK